MDNEIFSFFSERDVEQIAYVKRGSTLGIDYVTPDVDIEQCDWRVYASNDGGESWVSDTSPRYSTTSPWEYEIQTGVSGYKPDINQLAVTIAGDSGTKDYILVGIWT